MICYCGKDLRGWDEIPAYTRSDESYIYIHMATPPMSSLIRAASKATREALVLETGRSVWTSRAYESLLRAGSDQAVSHTNVSRWLHCQRNGSRSTALIRVLYERDALPSKQKEIKATNLIK